MAKMKWLCKRCGKKFMNSNELAIHLCHCGKKRKS